MKRSLLILILLSNLLACSSHEKKQKPDIVKDYTDQQKYDDCHSKNKTIDQRHLAIAAKSKARVFKRCFENFVKFETNKNQKIFTCNLLTINSDGSVKYVYGRGQFGTDLPKDLKMCLEQEMFQFDFSGLQLNNSLTVQFPVEFNSN